MILLRKYNTKMNLILLFPSRWMPCVPWCSVLSKLTSPKEGKRWSTTSDHPAHEETERSGNVASERPTIKSKIKFKLFYTNLSQGFAMHFGNYWRYDDEKKFSIHLVDKIDVQFCQRSHTFGKEIIYLQNYFFNHFSNNF